jgi:hypothetical protein
MQFTSEMLADEIKVPVTFSRLYRDEQGNPVTFNFTLRIETGEDSEAFQARFAGRQATVHEKRVSRLAPLVMAMPAELADFKPNGDMRKSVETYFAAKKWEHFVRGLLNNYDQALTPDELFR